MELMKSNYNIINKILDTNINILYEPANNNFDDIIKSLEFNIISKKNILHSAFYYDCMVINNWQKHIADRLSTVSDYQITDVLVFHDPCPDKFKKEDKIILNNNLKTGYKIFPTPYIYKTWGLKDPLSLQINYGIPFIVGDNKRTKNIVIINTLKNEMMFSIFNFIRNIYPDTEILTELSDINHHINTLSQYKTIIDFTNTYSNLLCIASGGQLITNIFLDSNIRSPLIINDISNIPHILKDINLLSIRNKLISTDQSYILETFSLNKFISSISDLFKKIKREPFIL